MVIPPVLSFFKPPKIPPLSELALNSTSSPPELNVVSRQVTYTSLPNAATSGVNEFPLVPLKLIGGFAFALKNTSELPREESSHVTYVSVTETASCGFDASPPELITNSVPGTPPTIGINEMLPAAFCHTTYTSVPSDAICGLVKALSELSTNSR